MRILHLGKFYPIKGGIEKVMYDIVTEMSQSSDVCCDMLCAYQSNETKTIQINNAQIICTPTWIKAFSTMISPGMVLKLKKICKDYDIIQIHHPDPMAALALRLSGYKGKVILHWHSDILKQKLTLRLYSPLQKWLIHRADVIVGTTPVYIEKSPFLQDSFLKKLCIPIGIDAIVPDKAKVQKIRQQYNGKKILFSLGRLVDYKGYRYLIEAANYLSDDYVILIGGSGPLCTELESIINTYSLQNKVFLLGRIPDNDLPNYYGACDLYVLSSIWKTEAFGIVQIEAMSCGKPVIATKIEGSGTAWVNQDGVSGINIETQDAKAIAKAADYILSDKDRYLRFSQAALHRYEELFRKEQMINRFIGLYRSLV